jgi:hypothetical protein
MIVAAVLGPELTELLLVSRPAAVQLPEIGRVDPHAAPLGTVPVTVTVIEAESPLAREKPSQVIFVFGCLVLPEIVTCPAFGSVLTAPADAHPTVPPWIFIA